MLEDFVSDAGVFQEPAATPSLAEAGFERRLRRALGDDYELLEEIGTGGFGRVYRARDLGLERDVAIKVLHPSLTADAAVSERFRREAQLAARLRHPSIVSIYDIMGRAGLEWYTMELVPGTNLAQLVQTQGPLSVEQTVRVLEEGLSALDHAHPRGHPGPPDDRRSAVADGRPARRAARAGRGAAPGTRERPGGSVPVGERVPRGGAAVAWVPAPARGGAAGRVS